MLKNIFTVREHCDHRKKALGFRKKAQFCGKNRHNFCYRSAFTLIEMVIVLAIIGILAVLAVSSFGTSQRQAQLTLAVDGLMTALQEQSGKAQSGQKPGISSTGAQVQFYCFGLRISKTAPFIQYLSAPYIAADQQNADYCSTNTVATDFTVAENLEILSLHLDEMPYDQVEIFFKPPSGKTVFSTAPGQTVNASVLQVSFGYPGQTAKTLQFDNLTKKTTLIPNPEL